MVSKCLKKTSRKKGHIYEKEINIYWNRDSGVFLLLLGTYKLMNSRTHQLFGGLTEQVETNQKVVALTFDDGPTKKVNQILPLLDKYNAKATFFLIGEEIEKHPEETKKIVQADIKLEIILFLIIEWYSKHLPILNKKLKKQTN